VFTRIVDGVLSLMLVGWLVGWLEFIFPFQHKDGYIRDDADAGLRLQVSV